MKKNWYKKGNNQKVEKFELLKKKFKIKKNIADLRNDLLGNVWREKENKNESKRIESSIYSSEDPLEYVR